MRGTAVLFFKSSVPKTAIRATEKEIEVKAPWGKIAGLTWGDPSNQPVLLCHGRLDTCSSYRRLIEYLPENRYYVGIDLPGNGRSNQLPVGARYSMFDYVMSLVAVRDHFDWSKFVYVGHSLGAALGKFYNLFYPGFMSKVIELDPEPAYLPLRYDVRQWYMRCYDRYYRDYQRNTAGIETAPKYKYEEIRAKIMKARGIDEQAADNVLERCLVPAGDGLHRLVFDQRLKVIEALPFTVDKFKEMYTASSTPTLAIFATETVERGAYKDYPFAMEDSAWPNGNYKSILLPGGHDVHLQKTEEVCRLMTEFLGEGH